MSRLIIFDGDTVELTQYQENTLPHQIKGITTQRLDISTKANGTGL